MLFRSGRTGDNDSRGGGSAGVVLVCYLAHRLVLSG